MTLTGSEVLQGLRVLLLPLITKQLQGNAVSHILDMLRAGLRKCVLSCHDIFGRSLNGRIREHEELSHRNCTEHTKCYLA